MYRERRWGVRTRLRSTLEPERGDKRLVEVKVAGIEHNGTGAGGFCLEVVLAEGRRIEVKRGFDAETLARLIRTLEEL